MNDGGYYSPSGYILRRRMRSAGTGHRAVDRNPAPSMDSLPSQQATAMPPKRPFVPYIPNENTGITGTATSPLNSNPIMEYLQRMLLNVRPR
jgi:hypothetical protein